MQAIRISIAALLFLVPAISAQAQLPEEVAIRYSAQISNTPAGTCGCFALQGAAVDLNWKLNRWIPALGVAADVGVEHTGYVNGAGYGLTLTSFTAGPRVALPAYKVHPFVQALFGLAHGSGSQFPQNGALVSSANSFALDLGAGADYPVGRMFSVRVLQLDYLRTSLPNNTNSWQNNLRIGAGISLFLPR